MLKVLVYPDSDAIVNDEPQGFEVDYVSYVAPTTYGPPALVAPTTAKASAGQARATSGETVLYLNTAHLPAWKITRLED